MHARRSVAAILGVVALAGCTSDDDQREPPVVVQLGSPGEPGRELTEDAASALNEPPHTPADVAFVQGMIHHHEQALVMTALVADRTGRDDIPLLAERMDVSQRDEIVQLESWLEDRGEQVPDASSHEHHGGDAGNLMPGMLTEADLDRLGRATGRDFDELFLLYMIRHHEGALVMVDELLSGGAGGQEPAVFQLAQHIDADQRIEIARMNGLLADIAASSTP
ncbi:MAG: DUF305 domain-containing protein [Jiangellaceae bacterium]